MLYLQDFLIADCRHWQQGPSCRCEAGYEASCAGQGASPSPSPVDTVSPQFHCPFQARISGGRVPFLLPTGGHWRAGRVHVPVPGLPVGLGFVLSPWGGLWVWGEQGPFLYTLPLS